MALQPNPDSETSTLPADHFDGDDPTWAISVRERRQVASSASDPIADPLDESPVGTPTDFWPRVPEKFQDTGLRPSQVEALVLKYLLNFAMASGR